MRLASPMGLLLVGLSAAAVIVVILTWPLWGRKPRA